VRAGWDDRFRMSRRRSPMVVQVLKDIHIPDQVLAPLQKAMVEDRRRSKEHKRHESERLQQRLSGVRRRIDQAYLDKLDGKISEDFWLRKMGEWQGEERQILIAIQGLDEIKPERVLDNVRILELANKAHSLYVRQDSMERAKLLRIVLSNCRLDATSVYPTYRKPFDLICGAAKTGEWYARGDSNTRPLAS
jgi:site-specific DNA recombinase